MVENRAGAQLSQKRMMGRRRMVLVDIENVVGGSAAVRDNVVWARAAVERVVQPRPGDHVVVGVGPAALVDLGCGWIGVRYVMGRGPDGADTALIGVLGEQLAERFAEIILVSGDGIFAEMIADLGARGLRTTVIAHADGLSRRLALAAHSVSFLPSHPVPQSSSDVTGKVVA